MFPKEFIERISTQEYIDSDSLLRALSEPSPVSIRINRRKWNKTPSGSKKVPWCNDGFYLESRPSFTADPLFHAGCYYPQETSSMFIEEVFRQLIPVNEGIRVLDLCAAPGGKSTHISSIIAGKGVLVANEVIRQRAVVLSEILTRWGTGNTIVTNSDPAAFSRLTGYFDVILADAPCSGEGMFRDRVAIDEWSPHNAAHCSERQKRILDDAWPGLKENGILIYSTCTFNPAENEENISWLTTKTGAEPVGLDVSAFKGVTEVCYKNVRGYGFYPGKTEGEGFFIAVVRKTGSLQQQKDITAGRKHALVTKNDYNLVNAMIEAPHEKILRRNDLLSLLPVNAYELAFLSGHLRIVKTGTNVVKLKGRDIVPLHDLAMAADMKSDAFPVFEGDHGLALSYMRRDTIAGVEMPVGWFLISYRGIRLGFMKNIGPRLNNYFPVEWRIRMKTDAEREKGITGWKE